MAPPAPDWAYDPDRRPQLATVYRGEGVDHLYLSCPHLKRGIEKAETGDMRYIGLGKACLDALKDNGIIEDDSNRYVKRLSFEWCDDGPPCVVLVQPREAA